MNDIWAITRCDGERENEIRDRDEKIKANHTFSICSHSHSSIEFLFFYFMAISLWIRIQSLCWISSISWQDACHIHHFQWFTVLVFGYVCVCTYGSCMDVLGFYCFLPICSNVICKTIALLIRMLPFRILFRVFAKGESKWLRIHARTYTYTHICIYIYTIASTCLPLQYGCAFECCCALYSILHAVFA